MYGVGVRCDIITTDPNIFRAQSIYREIYVQYLYSVFFTQKGALVNLENAAQLLLTLNEHNCSRTLICLKHFSKPRKERYISLLNAYFDKIKNEHGNVHFLK